MIKKYLPYWIGVFLEHFITNLCIGIYALADAFDALGIVLGNLGDLFDTLINEPLEAEIKEIVTNEEIVSTIKSAVDGEIWAKHRLEDLMVYNNKLCK